MRYPSRACSSKSAAIRAAESLLGASDAELLPRAVTLLSEVFVRAHATLNETPSASIPT
jgi:hypothetical protein